MRVLVTGGGGFLGRYVVEQLVARGDQVRTLARGRYPELEALGVEAVQGDLRDEQAALAACAGMDAVFHVASKTGVWGDRREFQDINVTGTAHILGGCLRHGVSRLIYTSSPSVVWSPGEHLGVDESAPYPDRFNCIYPETKAMAERMVLAANGTKGLLTVSLRPHLIWGPRDTQLIPRILDRARSGSLMQVGDGTNRVDFCYVENAADAHLLAADRLTAGSPVAGRAYFISQGEPVNLWDWINGLLEKLGVAPVRRSISYGAAWALGAMLEGLYGALKKTDEPRMTRFLAHQLAKSHYFDITAARRDLRYAPRIGADEGLERLVASLTQAATG